MKDTLLDFERALLLLRKGLKFGLAALAREVFKSRSQPATYAVTVREALEEMGLTYLKLGQYLAMRFDILPEELCRELGKLFEDVPPLAFHEVQGVIESELGGPLENFFDWFERRPIAAASVAQVHKARTLGGEKVAVKVQRPGIDRIFDSDMRILGRLAALLDDLFGGGKFRIKDAFDQFEKWTRRELNFITEGDTAERLRENAQHEIVPRIFWDLTTKKVITMELIDGISMGQIARIMEEGGLESVRKLLPNINLEKALHNLSKASLHQLFMVGFFHGDPHPGNILVLDDNSVAFVDFGIFGELTVYQRDLLANHIESLALGNTKESFRYYMKLGYPSEDTDVRAFERAGETALRRWYQALKDVNTSTQARHLGGVSGEVTAVVRQYHYIIDADTLLFWRAINALDSTALLLSPQFDLLRELQTFFHKMRPGPFERLFDLSTDRKWVNTVVELNSGMTGYVNNLLSDLSRGYYPGSFELEESEPDDRMNDRIARGLSAGVTGLSFAVLAASAYFSGSIRILFSVVAVSLFLKSLIETRLK